MKKIRRKILYPQNFFQFGCNNFEVRWCIMVHCWHVRCAGNFYKKTLFCILAWFEKQKIKQKWQSCSKLVEHTARWKEFLILGEQLLQKEMPLEQSSRALFLQPHPNTFPISSFHISVGEKSWRISTYLKKITQPKFCKHWQYLLARV
jgi:hypothetical protein